MSTPVDSVRSIDRVAAAGNSASSAPIGNQMAECREVYGELIVAIVSPCRGCRFVIDHPTRLGESSTGVELLAQLEVPHGQLGVTRPGSPPPWPDDARDFEPPQVQRRRCRGRRASHWSTIRCASRAVVEALPVDEELRRGPRRAAREHSTSTTHVTAKAGREDHRLLRLVVPWVRRRSPNQHIVAGTRFDVTTLCFIDARAGTFEYLVSASSCDALSRW